MRFFSKTSSLRSNNSCSGFHQEKPLEDGKSPLTGPRFLGRSLAKPGNKPEKALKIKNYPFKKSERIGDDENGADYYKIVQDKDKKIKFIVQVENKEGIFGPNLTFEIQNSKGNRLESDQVSGTDTDKLVRKLKNGTYFIKVSTGGESVPYELKVKKA